MKKVLKWVVILGIVLIFLSSMSFAVRRIRVDFDNVYTVKSEGLDCVIKVPSPIYMNRKYILLLKGKSGSPSGRPTLVFELVPIDE